MQFKKKSKEWLHVRGDQTIHIQNPTSRCTRKQRPFKKLAPHGYFEVTHTPILWKHITRPISLPLVVDDFGVKYIDKADAEHLIAALKKHY